MFGAARVDYLSDENLFRRGAENAEKRQGTPIKTIEVNSERREKDKEKAGRSEQRPYEPATGRRLIAVI